MSEAFDFRFETLDLKAHERALAAQELRAAVTTLGIGEALDIIQTIMRLQAVDLKERGGDYFTKGAIAQRCVRLVQESEAVWKISELDEK